MNEAEVLWVERGRHANMHRDTAALVAWLLPRCESDAEVMFWAEVHERLFLMLGHLYDHQVRPLR